MFLQIIHTKFQYQFEDENSFYNSSINYALIRQFLVKELSIKISINYDYALEGDEMELGKVTFFKINSLISPTKYLSTLKLKKHLL